MKEIIENEEKASDIKIKNDLMKSEYTEISKYIVELVRTRFVVFGGFIAGALVLLSTQRPPIAYAFGLTAALCVVIIDLRNRLLISQLCFRAMVIEKAFPADQILSTLPFWTLQQARNPSLCETAGHDSAKVENYSSTIVSGELLSIKFMTRSVPIIIQPYLTHSNAIDISYFAFTMSMLWQLMKIFIFRWG